MRKFTFLIAVFIFGAHLYSQETVDYAKIEDNPDLVADRMVTTSFSGQYGNNSEPTVGLEVNALYKIQKRLSLFGGVNYGIINFSPFASYDIEAGALFKFRTKDKIDDVKVVMSWSDNTTSKTNYNSNDGRTYETTTRERSMDYIDEKAIYRKEFSARGGLFMNKITQEVGFANVPLFQTGVFVGFESSKKAAVITTINGEKGITSGLTRLYADALFTPIDRMNSVSNGFGIGGRAGFNIYMLPSKSVNAKPEEMDARQAYSLYYFKSEIGIRPTQGWFFMLGVGIMIYKNR